MTPKGEIKILTTYHPKGIESEWRAWKIGRDLTRITADLGFTPFPNFSIKQNKKAAWYREELHAEVRKTAKAGSEGTSWHVDGDTSPNAPYDCGIVLWANTHPTIVKTNGVYFEAEPFTVIWINNLSVLHRRPPDAPEKRWSFRQRVIL